MPESIIPPSTPTTNFFIPQDTDGPKVNTLKDDYEHDKLINSLLPSPLQGGAEPFDGRTITDMINQVQSINDESRNLLNNYQLKTAPSNFDIDTSSIFNTLSQKANPETPTLQASNKPMVLGTEADYNRYAGSKHFQSYGYTPNLGEEQEYKYGRAMTWGETIGKALGGATELAANTFVEGWKGWGRMANALFSWDSSKLMGSEEERYEMAKKQEEIMNKYAIYETPESKDSVWNRQFFGTMLQQSGFAIGAGLQFASEELLTGGLGGIFSGIGKGVVKGVEAAKTLTRAEEAVEAAGLAGKTAFKPAITKTLSQINNDARIVMNTASKQSSIMNSIANGVKKLVPGYGTVEEMIKLNKAGAGFAQLSFTGLGGIRRGLSEFNMARSESIFEAAGTYTQLKDRLVQEYTDKNGKAPEGDALERIKQSAENASHDNFWTNIGVLSVMNRIQFDGMFKSFSKSRSLLGEGVSELQGKAFQVGGKDITGKQLTKVYEKGLFGSIGSIGEVAKDFGAKKAAWVATKSIGKGLMKFEGSEGMQELLQTASDKGLGEYYYDLYHGKKGYGSKLDSVLSNVQNPFTDMEGMKTFLMGALTGRLIAPLSGGFTMASESIQERNSLKKAAENSKVLKDKLVKEFTDKTGKAPEGDDLANIDNKVKESTDFKTKKQKVKEAIGMMNSLYQDPAWFQKESLANIKVNNLAAETMDQAVANRDKYTFNNSKDSAFAKTVAAAIKLDMYDSLRDTIKEYGAEMNEEEFKQAFGIDATSGNKKGVKELTSSMVDSMEDYFQTFKNLKDKYGDAIIPELYKNNDPEVYKNARLQKFVLDNAIEMLATNSYKAKQAMKRGISLRDEMAKNPNIGGSSSEIVTKLGSELGMNMHINTLRKDIATMQMPGAILTKEQKEVLEDNKRELDLLLQWKDSKEELLNQIEVDKSYRVYAELINLFNKRAGKGAKVSRNEVEDNFMKFTDYLRLNNDSDQFIDAMNLLAEPKNMSVLVQAMTSAQTYIQRKFFEEHKEELFEQLGLTEKDIPAYTVEKNEDGKWSVFDKENVEVASGLATEEEANAIAEQKNAEFEEMLAKEETDDIEGKKAAIEKKYTFNRDSIMGESEGTAIAKKGEIVLMPEKVASQLSVGDRIEFFDERKRTGIWNGKSVIEDGTNNPWGIVGILGNPANYLKNLTKIDEEIAVLEGKPEQKISNFEQAKKAIADAKTSDDLTAVLEFITSDLEKLTKEEHAELEKLFDAKEAELKKVTSVSTKTTKVYSDTDPEFVNAFNAALTQIASVLNKPGVTVEEATAIYKELTPVFNMLSPEKKQEYMKKYLAERREKIEQIEKENRANNVQGVKDLISKTLSDDTLSFDDAVNELLNILNTELKPEYKEDVIAHFEQEYSKAIERKIEALNKQANSATDNPLIKEFLEDANKFRDKVRKNLETFEAKSTELSEKRNGISYNVEVDPLFKNSVHRSILENKNKSRSSGQLRAINNLKATGFLTEKEILKGDTDSKHGASELINLGVARILTLQINKAAAKHFNNGESTDLKEVLRKYLADALNIDPKDKKDKELLDEAIKEALDKTIYPDVDALLSHFSIPRTEELSNEAYAVINEYNASIKKVIDDSNVLDIYDALDNRQAQLIEIGSPATAEDIITKEIVDLFGSYLQKVEKEKYRETLASLRTDIISAFNSLSGETDSIKALKAVSAIAGKYFSINKAAEGKDLLSALMAYGLQTENLLKTEEDNTQPLTEEEMAAILNNPKESLSKEQISQLEEFAKTKQLENYRKKLQAATGYDSPGVGTYIPNLKQINTIKRFSALRQKNALDQRTLEDLTAYLMPDEEGNVNTKVALNFIIYQSFATDAEKELARKLLDIVQDDDVIKVNNTIKDAGEYDPDTNQAVINLEKSAYKPEGFSTPVETVILHELLHAATEKAIADPNSEYGKAIRAVFNAVKDKEGANTFYAFQESLKPDEQLREFVVEAFTNPAFQYLLAKTPYKNTGTSLWDRFLEIITDLLNKFGVNIRDTALYEVLSLTDNILGGKPSLSTAAPIIATPQGGGPVVLPSEKFLEDIKNAKTEEELTNIYKELQDKQETLNSDIYNSLEASLKRKLQSINGAKVKEDLKSYTSIKIDGVTYYYAIKNNALSVVKVGNYKLNNIRRAEIVEKVAKQLLSKQNITTLMSTSDLNIIRGLGGNPETQGSYASGMMPNSGETLFEQKYPNVRDIGPHIRLRFGDLQNYRKFKNDYRKYRRGQLSLGDLKSTYGPIAVQDFGELFNRLGGKMGRSEFASIDKLINKGLIELDGKNPTLTDITYDTGLSYDELMDYYEDIINNVDLEKTEYDDIKDYINKTLSKFLGMPVSDELQRELEAKIFNIYTEDNHDVPDDFDVEDGMPAYTISTDLADANYVEDPGSTDFTQVRATESLAATEPYALRSRSYDIKPENGALVENDNFMQYYYKIRQIINILSLSSEDKLSDLHVTLDNDSENLRWDGSAQTSKWINAKKGIIGYISDSNGNPIVFNSKGEKVGVLDRNNLSDTKGLNNGQNQIVYFNTTAEDANPDILAKLESTSKDKLFAARQAVREGKPQIAKVVKISQGQMVLRSKVKAGVVSLKNTARDKDLAEGLSQDHVFFNIGNKLGQIIATVKATDGAVNNTVLFTPSTRAVKINTPTGTYGLFEHLVELMKVYHQLDAEGYTRIGDIQKNLVNFAYNIWLTGDKYSLKIPQNFMSVTISKKGTNGIVFGKKIDLFKMVDGVMTLDQDAFKQANNFINNLKLNVYDKWLTGEKQFKFPYISEVNGKKMINFENKNFKDFLINEVGLLSYIEEVPDADSIKRYNSAVHFSTPVNLQVKPTGIDVTEQKVIDDPNAVKQAVNNAIKTATPEPGKVAKPTPRTKFKAPSFEDMYEKICK